MCSPPSLRHSHPRDLLLWLLRRRRRLRVAGRSMVPLLQPGEEVLIAPHAYRHRLPEPGDLVVSRHPHTPDLLLIKAVAQADTAEGCVLLGYNRAESTDSRQFGPVPLTALVGQVVCRLP